MYGRQRAPASSIDINVANVRTRQTTDYLYKEWISQVKLLFSVYVKNEKSSGINQISGIKHMTRQIHVFHSSFLVRL